MLRRLGPMALTLGSLLSAGWASAQAPVGAPAGSSSPATSHAAPPGGLMFDRNSFNAIDVYDQMRSNAQKIPATVERPGELYQTAGSVGPAGCSDCGGRGCDSPGCGGRGGLFGHDGHNHNGQFDPGPQFQCANCWSWTNVEHKTFINYHYLYPLRTATKVGYGPSHGTSAGVEWLPYVLRDNERQFTRWGWLTAFDYNHYIGDDDSVMISEETGNVVTSAHGNSFGFLFGPVWRTDFFLFGKLRISPSLSAGLDFDWVSMSGKEPTVSPPPLIVRPDPQPTFSSAVGATVRPINKIRFTDFSIGGYGRVLFDFPIKSHLNVGIGMEGRFIPSKTFMRNDDMRKHFGLILQISGDW